MTGTKSRWSSPYLVPLLDVDVMLSRKSGDLLSIRKLSMEEFLRCPLLAPAQRGSASCGGAGAELRHRLFSGLISADKGLCTVRQGPPFIRAAETFLSSCNAERAEIITGAQRICNSLAFRPNGADIGFDGNLARAKRK